MTQYNHSENAVRSWTALRRISGAGKTRILIRCPFCKSESWAHVWSLCGSGKRCEHKPCGAMFGSTGDAAPVVGREHKFDAPVISCYDPGRADCDAPASGGRFS